MAEKKTGIKIITDNRRALHEYTFLEKHEAGISLMGTEVKSMRAGKANLQDAYAKIEDGEIWLYNFHVSPYDFGNRFNHEEKRPRRLLMHKGEINKLYAKVREKGLTLVPTKVYFVRGLVKVEIALAQGKKIHDKRDAIAAKDVKRDVERALRERQKY